MFPAFTSKRVRERKRGREREKKNLDILKGVCVFPIGYVSHVAAPDNLISVLRSGRESGL